MGFQDLTGRMEGLIYENNFYGGYTFYMTF
jgi:hypothetical protein